MNKKYENKMTSFEGISSLLAEHGDRVQAVAGFAEAVAAFDAALAGIRAKSIEVDGASAGRTSDKHNAEEELVECLMPVCSALYIFGRRRKDPSISERAYTTESKLFHMRDTELANFGTAMANLAGENGEGIAALGITAEKIDDLRAKAGAYSASIGARESGVADRKGARESLARLFASADELLNDELDHFMEIARPADEEFYGKYFAARIIRDTGIRHRKVEESPEAVGAAKE